MWVRQEYKPEKAKFQNAYELEIGEVEEKGTKIKRTVKLEQNYSGLGTTVWDGSIALAKSFDNKNLFPSEKLQSSSVLELGAGCGLVGIYLSQLGAKRTVLTDQACCIPTLMRNIKLNTHCLENQIPGQMTAIEYSWGNDTSNLIKDGLFDIVVAAEVLYSEEDSIKLAKCIPKLIHSLSLIFVSMGRNRLGENAFTKTVLNYGFNVEEVITLSKAWFPYDHTRLHLMKCNRVQLYGNTPATV